MNAGAHLRFGVLVLSWEFHWPTSWRWRPILTYGREPFGLHAGLTWLGNGIIAQWQSGVSV